jgi:hypothetical protein
VPRPASRLMCQCPGAGPGVVRPEQDPVAGGTVVRGRYLKVAADAEVPTGTVVCGCSAGIAVAGTPSPSPQTPPAQHAILSLHCGSKVSRVRAQPAAAARSNTSLPRMRCSQLCSASTAPRT